MIVARPDVCIVMGRICDITEGSGFTMVRIDADGIPIDLKYSNGYIKKMKPKIGGKVCCTAEEKSEFFICADGGKFDKNPPIIASGLSLLYSGPLFIRGKKLFKNLETVYGTVVRTEEKENCAETLVTFRCGNKNTTKVIRHNPSIKKLQEGKKYLFLQETTREAGGAFWATKII